MWEAIYEKLKTIHGLGSSLFCILEYLLCHILFSNCLYTLFWQGTKQLVSLTQTLSQNRRAYITIDLLSRHGIRRVSRSAAGCFKHIVSSIDLSEEKVSRWNKRLEFGWADFGEELFSDVSVAWVLTYRRRMYPCINRPCFDYLTGYQCTLTAVIKIYQQLQLPSWAWAYDSWFGFTHSKFPYLDIGESVEQGQGVLYKVRDLNSLLFCSILFRFKGIRMRRQD